jgi:hypothetical protein
MSFRGSIPSRRLAVKSLIVYEQCPVFDGPHMNIKQVNSEPFFVWMFNILMGLTLLGLVFWCWGVMSGKLHNNTTRWSTGITLALLLGIQWFAYGRTLWDVLKKPSPRIRLRERLLALPLAPATRATYLAEFDNTAGMPLEEAQKVFEKAEAALKS